MKKSVYLLIICLLIVSACRKAIDEDPVDRHSKLISFENLTAGKDSLRKGESTTITANAVGENITYNWSASQGPVLGDGKEVLYLVSPCCTGNGIITCEVKAYNNTITRSIVITVIP